MSCTVWQLARGAFERVGSFDHPSDAKRLLRTTIQRGAAIDGDGEVIDSRGLERSELAALERAVGEWISSNTPSPEARERTARWIEQCGAVGAGPEDFGGSDYFGSSDGLAGAPPEVCPSPTLPAPEGLFDGPPEVVRDLRAPKLYALPSKPSELEALRARVAELEALLREAQAYADAAGVRAAVAESTADAAVAAMARRSAPPAKRPRVRVSAAPVPPIAAIEAHLAARARR